MKRLKVHNLSKRYIIGGVQNNDVFTLYERLLNAVRERMTPTHRDPGREHWALKDINFEVGDGSIVGLIGRNGAGKSTLLKILSRISPPTTGEIEIHGRVGCLLEVGSGLHPELTGYENIFLMGAIMGMRKAEIKRRFDEIVEFSGVGKFINTPLKRYSSGMAMRLGFSVAAHMEAEILLVDEALTTGDVEFQRKCLNRMLELAKSDRTVLFVSHNMAAIERMTNQCLLLESGRLELFSDTRTAIDTYFEKCSNKKGIEIANWPERGGDQSCARIVKFMALSASGSPKEIFRPFEPITFVLGIDFAKPVVAEIGLVLETSTQHPLFETFLGDSVKLREWSGYQEFKIEFNENHLSDGIYNVSIGVYSPELVDNYDVVMHFLALEIEGHPEMGDSGRLVKRQGNLVYALKWESHSPAKPKKLRKSA